METGEIKKPMTTKKTKQTAPSWGGKRAGSGRKRKPEAPEIAAPPVIPDGLSGEELNQFLESLALEAIARVARDGLPENARVAAGRELLAHAKGAPANPTTPGQDDGWGDLLRAPARPAAPGGRAN